ncbi:MAG: hypothetical protein NC830_04565 [Candidatus Omnitrophica bacterium]|nr:hypothetical protein [Candidatus Omnitrophota bacterium]
MKKGLYLIFIIFIIGIAGLYFLKPQNQGQQLPELPEIKEETKPAYRYVTEKPAGWFKTGQEADIVLYATGFNESGGPLVLNHPGKVATDGKRLIVSDTWNNRVLIWNEIPAKNNQPPNLVLGQPDFNSNIAGLGADKLNWPMGVATDGKRLLVADAFNSRILIWNSFPTRNGQPADLVLGAIDFDTWPYYFDLEGSKRHEDWRDPRKRIDWPWDVWTDGNKIIVTSTVDGSVLIWNSFPTENYQAADLVLGPKNFSTRFGRGPSYFGTPRSIASDGKHLVIGDYNAEVTFVWSEFPTESGQLPDFTLEIKRQEDEPSTGAMGLALKDNKLYATGSHHIFVWNDFPNHTNQKPDMRIGAQRTRDEMLLAPDKMKLFADTFNSPYGIATDGKKLILADTNNNRVLIFNTIPTKSITNADVVLGAPDFETNNFISRIGGGFGSMPFSDGERLILGGDGFGAYIYNHIPDESKAKADVVVGKLLSGTVVGGYTITDGNKLIMVHREGNSVFIWNKIPEKDNQLPDVILGAKIVLDEWGIPGTGRTGFNGPQGAATDGKQLFVADTENNRILVWNEIPTQNQTPADFVLGQPDFDKTEPKTLPPVPESVEGIDLYGLDHPDRISTDGKHLAATDSSGRILIWKLPILENDKRPEIILLGNIYQRNGPFYSEGLPVKSYGPDGISIWEDKLFVIDASNNRVLIWNKLPTEHGQLPDIILGQPDWNSIYPSNSKRSFAVFPSYLSFDGSFLWVGEMKWSNRLLRFSVQPTE